MTKAAKTPKTPHQPENFGACHQGGEEGIRMINTMGKVFVAQGSLRKCVICDVLMSRAASREHSAGMCFPTSPACPPIPHGVTAGAA